VVARVKHDLYLSNPSFGFCQWPRGISRKIGPLSTGCLLFKPGRQRRAKISMMVRGLSGDVSGF
jgi:hypothetical protein